MNEYKPVIEATQETMMNYEYWVVQNVVGTWEDRQIILASDSLINLKKEVKNRGWRFVYIESNDLLSSSWKRNSI